MNKRIRELAQQADIHFYPGRVPETGFEYEGAEVTVEDLTKFAELILTEVISTIYRSDISDKKQEKLVDELTYKFGMK